MVSASVLPDMVELHRNDLGAQTCNMVALKLLNEACLLEKPYMSVPEKDWVGGTGETWHVEKQFWLKYKKEFQMTGFLPLQSGNMDKKF